MLTAKPQIHLAAAPCADYIELFSMNVNLKMFCILCLCIILCDTSKTWENLTFVLKQSLIQLNVFVVIIAWSHEDQTLCRTNDIRFISKL